MNRITVEQVKEAYRVTGRDIERGSAVSVLAQRNGYGKDIWEYLDSVGPEYGVGFLHGASGSGKNDAMRHQPRWKQYCEGYADGLAVAAAIWG